MAQMIPKACEGVFDETIQRLLRLNADREQWRMHRCATCGQQVDPVQKKGLWVPEPHWASIPYSSLDRKRPTSKHARTHPRRESLAGAHCGGA